MSTGEATIGVRLGFTSSTQAIADKDHPGLLRAGERSGAPYGGEHIEVHVCRATDLCQDDSVQPDLFEFGFTTVDLSSHAALQEVFARVVSARHIGDDDATEIRAALDGATLACGDGRDLEVLYVSDEGLIMRTSGPNGLSVDDTEPGPAGMNGHGVATSIHADQDVYGTPLTQLMDGKAPSLLRHDSPDGHNHDAGLMLINLWIPLQQITQPLSLGDGRSVDRRRHQLRYGLRTTSFLDRDDDMAINDLWTFLHDPDQRWYLRSELDHTSGYVFNTLSTPHGAGTLPGEELAERCYLALEAGEDAVRAGDAAALTRAVEPVRDREIPEDVPPALRAAIAAMTAVADDAAGDPAAVCGERAEAWLQASADARQRVIRMSLELRMVVSVNPASAGASA